MAPVSILWYLINVGPFMGYEPNDQRMNDERPGFQEKADDNGDDHKNDHDHDHLYHLYHQHHQGHHHHHHHHYHHHQWIIYL